MRLVVNGLRKQPADPAMVARRERDAQMRQLTTGPTAPTELGNALIHTLTTVDPGDT